MRNGRHYLGGKHPQPVNRRQGLSSPINRVWVKEILDCSARDEVAALLREIGYKDRREGQRISEAELKSALQQALAAYLDSAEGRADFQHRKETALKSRCEEYLVSPEGQRRLTEIKLRLAAGQVSRDTDVFERACRDEIARQVERWLASPAGQEAVEQERHRKIRSAAEETSRAKGGSWIERTIKQ
jgi:hypothetical protein